MKRVLVCSFALLLAGLFFISHIAASQAWVPTGNLPQARSSHQAFLLADGRVFVAGETDTGLGVPLPSAFYDPATGTWTAAATPSLRHLTPMAVRLSDGRIMFAGGRGADAIPRSNVEIFNPATNTWQATGQLARGRILGTLTLLQDGRVLMAGGYSIFGFDNSAEVWDPGTNAWTMTGFMPVGKWQHTATLLNDGRVLVAGGEQYGHLDGDDLNDAEIFNPGSGTWSMAAPMAIRRASHSAVRLHDGRVVVMGGVSGAPAIYNVTPTIEIYDAATNAWSFGASMPTGRADSAPLVAMPDGTFIAVGGQVALNLPAYTTAVDRYNPATDSWSALPSMSTARTRHTATLLPNGDILAAGGSNLSVADLNSVERLVMLEPVTTETRSLGPNGNGWNNTNVTVTLNATTSNGSVQSITYSLAGAQAGGATVAGNQAVVSITAEGSTTITYHATDNANNVESDHSITINIDKTAPTLNLPTDIIASATVSGGALVNFVAGGTDLLSGVVSTIIAPRQSGQLFPLGLTHETVTVTDAAGNTAIGGFDVTVVPGRPFTAINGGTFISDGNPHSATASVTQGNGDPVAGNISIGYAPGGVNAPITPGQYSAALSFTSNDPAFTNVFPWGGVTTDPIARHAATAGVIGGKMYVVGGHPFGDPALAFPALLANHAYDPVANTWTPRAAPPVARNFAAGDVINDKLYIAGGCIESNCNLTTNAFAAYDPTGDSWATLTPAPLTRNLMAGGAINGTLYLAGGAAPFDPTSGLQAYDTATHTWSLKANMPQPSHSSAAAVFGGKLYVIGGYDAIGPTKRVQVYDPASNSWSTRAPALSIQIMPAAAVINSRIYVFGGSDGTGQSVKTVQSYDPASDTWSLEPSLPTQRYALVAGAINGRVYVSGGSHLPSQVTGITEVFDPSLTTHITILNETTPPQSSHVVAAANANGWYNANVSVTINAIDPSGVQSISYSLSDAQTGTSTANANSVAFTITNEGRTTVTYHATDNVGNVENDHSFVIKIDKTSPTIDPIDDVTATATSAAGAVVNYPNPVAADLLSGLASVTTSKPSGSTFPIGSTVVTVTATDEAGNTTNGTFTVTVNAPAAPIAMIAVNPNPALCAQAVTFDGSGSHAANGFNISSYQWNFGDGSGAIGAIVQHNYQAFGTYQAMLTVTDNYSPAQIGVANVTVNVNQGNLPPFANAGGPYTVNFGNSVQLNGNASSDPNSGCGDQIVSYDWTIDGQYHSSGATPVLDTTTNPLTTGNHTIELTVTDTFGATGTASSSINVERVLVSISVTPTPVTLQRGQHQQFTAIGHYNNGDVEPLMSGPGGGGGGFFGPGDPSWQVLFPQLANFGVCSTPQYPLNGGNAFWGSQNMFAHNGHVDTTWSPGTPVVHVFGDVTLNNVTLTVECTRAAATGSINAVWTGTRYEGTLHFNNSDTPVVITGWSRKADMPSARFGLTAASADGKVYAIGGVGGSCSGGGQCAFAPLPNVDIYDAPAGSWSAGPSLVNGREGGRAAVLGNLLYVIGGHVSGGQPSGIVETLDLAGGNQWNVMATDAMPTARANFALVTDGTSLYAIGGDNDGGQLSTVERFDPTAPAGHRWTTLTSMPVAGNFIGAGVLNGKIVVAGAGGTNRVDIYDINDTTGHPWSAGTPMPAQRGAMASAVSNGGLWLIGGTTNGSLNYDSWVYYPQTNQHGEGWAGVGSMPTGRSMLGAAVIGDVIYAVGGADASNHALASNETLSTPPETNLTPSAGPSGSGGGNNNTVQWQSTNALFASIDNSGNATAMSIGESTIVATAGGISCQTTQTCATLTVVNSVPAVQIFGGQFTRQESSTFPNFNTGGNFSDPDMQNWTATVDYGDGGGAQPLVLSNVNNGFGNFGLAHTYTDNGLFTVTVSVDDHAGGVGVASVQVNVSNSEPQVFGPSGPNPVRINTNSAQNIGCISFFDVPNDGPWTAQVNYGDGSGDQDVTINTGGNCGGGGGGNPPNGAFNLSHLYTNAGNFTVTAFVTDKDRGTGSYSFPLTVNAPPVVVIDNTPLAHVNEGSMFNGSASLNDSSTDGPWQVTISYGDNSGQSPSTVFSTGSIPLSHVYRDNGSYTITVQVRDNFSATATATTTLVVDNVAPDPQLNGFGSVDEGAAATFDGQLFDGGALDAPWTGTVDFGDGTSQPLALVLNPVGSTPRATFSFTHTYNQFGHKTLTLTATDKDGATRSRTFPIDVNPIIVSVSISPAQATITTIGQTLLFNATALFSDGSTHQTNGNVIPEVTWSSSNQTAATIAANGLATAVGSGVTTIGIVVQDDLGHTFMAHSTLTVDVDAPVLSLPASIVTYATSPIGAAVPFTATALDAIDGATTVSCTPSSGSTFVIGVTTVQCSSADAQGHTATGSFTVTVLSAAQIVSELIGDIENFQQASGILNNVLSSLNSGNTAAACNQLGAFINQVQAQAGKKLTQAEADSLLQIANAAKAAIGCP